MPNTIYSFPPIAAADARVLILGSMPGEKSLQMQQYYAHPQNAFWRIMGELVGGGRELDYERRIAYLKAHRLGVWDVLMSCQRTGSLDSAIEPASIQSNDFNAFFAAHSQINHVFFNGGTAAAAYKRHVLPNLSPEFGKLQYERLPSTSPAHATLNFDEKLLRWQKILR